MYQFAHTDAHTGRHIYAHTHLQYTYRCTHKQTCLCTHTPAIHIQMHTQADMFMHTHTCNTHTCTHRDRHTKIQKNHTFMHTHAPTYTSANIYAHTYMYTNVCNHTHTHTHTHTCTQTHQSFSMFNSFVRSLSSFADTLFHFLFTFWSQRLGKLAIRNAKGVRSEGYR